MKQFNELDETLLAIKIMINKSLKYFVVGFRAGYVVG